MTDGATFALYVHVPWCRHVCPYCDFNVYARREIPETEDVAALAAELDGWSCESPFAGGRIASVFLGGGTPSLYAPATIERLLQHAKSCFAFDADAEITLEANPGTLTVESLRGYRRAGVNRLSLGVQSFDAATLRALGRDHGPDESRAVLSAARAAGFDNLSLDLVFGVPGQTLARWSNDLATAIALAPEHISTYSLTYEPGTPLARWRDQGRVRPVDEDDEAAMADLTCERLAGAGYERYEISSHARPGFGSRHNQHYWDGSSYLGIGPGAHSFAVEPLPGRRWENERLPDRYRARVAATGQAIATAENLSPSRAESDFVVTGLRRLVGVDGDAFAGRFGRGLFHALPQLETLRADGLVEYAGPRLRLTARGLRFADSVWSSLL